MALNVNGSFWKKLKSSKLAPMLVEESAPSALGCYLETDHGQIRAERLGGQGLIVVGVEFDQAMADLKQSDLIGKAPLSVGGF